MAQPTKPPVTSVWASTATDNVTPADSFIAAGWPLSTTPPSRGRFNWLLNYLYNGIRYFSRRGIADYDAAETYMTNDKTTGPDGLTYISLVDNNIANTPASSPSQWIRWGYKQTDFASLLGTSGYQKFPSGLIIQWVTLNIPDGTNGVVSAAWPIPFPNAFYGASPSIAGGASTTRKINTDSSMTGTTCAVNATNTGTSLATTGFVIGIGK